MVNTGKTNRTYDIGTEIHSQTEWESTWSTLTIAVLMNKRKGQIISLVALELAGYTRCVQHSLNNSCLWDSNITQSKNIPIHLLSTKVLLSHFFYLFCSALYYMLLVGGKMARCYGNWAHFSFMTSFSKSCCIKTSRERVGDEGRMGRLIRREQAILPLCKL